LLSFSTWWKRDSTSITICKKEKKNWREHTQKKKKKKAEARPEGEEEKTEKGGEKKTEQKKRRQWREQRRRERGERYKPSFVFVPELKHNRHTKQRSREHTKQRQGILGSRCAVAIPFRSFISRTISRQGKFSSPFRSFLIFFAFSTVRR